MAEITADMVKQLREATNVGMMECKKALMEAGGDAAKATKLLRERGIGVAAKRAMRSTNQGLLASAAADGGRIFSLVEVMCETDFVARNENFQAFVRKLAEAACRTDGNLADETRDLVIAKIAEIGENIVVRRNLRYQLKDTGRLGAYVHLGGKVGVLIEVGAQKDGSLADPRLAELVTDLTLHVTASAPRYLVPAEIPADVIAAEREIYAKQVKDKPPQIVQKIVDGKMKKFHSEVCLLEQPFVKEPKQSVAALLAATAKALEDGLTIRRFVRWQLGE